jgi:hypothetical protein
LREKASSFFSSGCPECSGRNRAGTKPAHQGRVLHGRAWKVNRPGIYMLHSLQQLYNIFHVDAVYLAATSLGGKDITHQNPGSQSRGRDNTQNRCPQFWFCHKSSPSNFLKTGKKEHKQNN